MDWYWFVAIYLGIGFFRASAHLSTGKFGAGGILVTFFTLLLLWPLPVTWPRR
jgi:hypothetical protein